MYCHQTWWLPQSSDGTCSNFSTNCTMLLSYYMNLIVLYYHTIILRSINFCHKVGSRVFGRGILIKQRPSKRLFRSTITRIELGTLLQKTLLIIILLSTPLSPVSSPTLHRSNDLADVYAALATLLTSLPKPSYMVQNSMLLRRMPERLKSSRNY